MAGSEEQHLGSDEEEVIASEELDEEERGSSAEEDGSDEDEDEDEDEEDGEGSDDSESARRPPRKKRRPFVAPPPRAMPQRTTRGARMGNLVTEEGDDDFWNQEFFAEEEQDERYETESEPEDRFDADFNESEDEGDEAAEAEEAEKEALDREKKKKALKPPGYKKPPLPKPKPAAAGDGGGGEGSAAGGGGTAGKKRRASIGPEDFTVERRTVRESTRQKVEEGEMERKMAEKYKPRRAPVRSANYRPLTQAELLAEAAKTEIENIKSLELLVLIEEETRKKAQVHKRRYAGPMVRWRSRAVDGAEMSTLEVRNMAMPPELAHRTAPPPPPRAVCAVTGAPARYRDPATGLPYADAEAFRELRRRRDAGLLAPLPGSMPAAASAAEVAVGQALQQGTSPAAARQSTRLQAAQQQQCVAPQQPAFDAALIFQQQLAAMQCPPPV